MPKRKRLSAIQKAQIVLETIREDKSVAEIATENSIHPNQIHKWKRQAKLYRSFARNPLQQTR